MNLPEFKALKRRLLRRTRLAIRRFGIGKKAFPGSYFVRLGDLELWQSGPKEKFDIQRYVTPGVAPLTIYQDDHDGKEIALGWSHVELVIHYQWALKIIDSYMLLEDLADV